MAEDVGDGSFSMNSSSVTCSICLEDVAVMSGRSMARLHCGHLFHLDCIGSEFNVRGTMQCPNCREIENGEWLFANRIPERSRNHQTEDNDVHGIVQMQPSGGQWVLGLPVPVYHAMNEQRPMFAHGPNYNHHWNGPPVPTEISASHALNAIYPHYRNLSNNFGFTPTFDHISGVNRASVHSAAPRFAQGESDSIPSPDSFAYPVTLNHGSGVATLGSVTSSTGLPYSGSNAPALDRFQVLRQRPLNNSPSPVVRASMLSGIGGSNRSRGLDLAQSTTLSRAQAGDSYPVISLGLPNMNLDLLPSEHLSGENESSF